MKPLPRKATRGIMHRQQTLAIMVAITVPVITLLWFVVVVGEYLLKHRKK